MDAMGMREGLLMLTAFGASLITLFTGFGVGTVILPVFALFFDVKIAVLLAAVIHGVNNGVKLLLYGRSIRWQVIRRFGAVSLIGAAAGSWAQMLLNSAWLKSSVGLFLIAYATWSLLPARKALRLPPGIDMAGGFFSGLLGGLIGNQGALRSLYLLEYGLDKKELIASAALLALIVDATRIPLYLYAQQELLQAQIPLLTLVVVAAVSGTLIGGRVLPHISYDWFKKMILLALLLVGSLLLLQLI